MKRYRYENTPKPNRGYEIYAPDGAYLAHVDTMSDADRLIEHLNMRIDELEKQVTA